MYKQQGTIEQKPDWTLIDGEYFEAMPSRQQVMQSSIGYFEKGCLMLIDTDRERQVQVGTRYPFKPMESKECTISESMAKWLNVRQNDIVYL
jgi:hypothetical protein